MGKIGDDLFGQAVTQLVSAYDPWLVGGMVVDPQANTSYTVVINPPGVDHLFLRSRRKRYLQRGRCAV